MNQTGCSADTTEPFALRVVGDSMSPEFEDGHIIIVDPGLQASDKVYVVVDHAGEILFGQFRQQDGRCWIHYLNPRYQPVELRQAYQVKGVIVQRSNGRRRDLKHYDYPGLLQ